MRNFRWLRVLAGVAMSACVLSGAALAQEPDQDDQGPADVLQLADDEDVVFVARAKAEEPGWWLGLQTEAVSDPILRKQLSLGDRGLVVVEVLADSPASKAGLQQHDVLIEAGGAELRSIEDLQGAVGKFGGKPLAIVVVRDGKRINVEARPDKRPLKGPPGGEAQEFNVELNTAKKAVDELLELHKRGAAPGAMRLRFVGPGVVGAAAMAEAELPKDVKITVSKQGKEPAQITVKRGDQSWEATAEKLGEIPEDLRVHVEQMLGRHRWEYRVEEKLPADVRERFMKWTAPLPPGAVPGIPVPPPGVHAGSVRVTTAAPVEVRSGKTDPGLAEVQREVARLRDELSALRKEISGRNSEGEAIEKLLRRLIEEQKNK
jgi:hypothetical protein